MEPVNYSISFQGKGSELFKIQIVNLILCIVTLGLYYPWAKAKTLQYVYGQTHFENHPFAFTGTGKQMFKGFIRAFILLLLIYVIFILLVLTGMPGLGALFFLIAFLLIFPIAMHGSYRYRFAKTVWNEIRFGYTGNRGELIRLFIKGVLLTIITFGIYGSWFTIKLRNYMLSNVRMGNASFVYQGDGGDYFLLNLKGYLLTIVTLGIYSFWWQKDLFNYYVNNLRLQQDDKAVFLHSKATGGGFAGLMIVNFLIIIFTLGLGFPWVAARTLRFVFNNVIIEGNIDFEQLQQEQPDYSDATGEDLAGFLDFGFVI